MRATRRAAAWYRRHRRPALGEDIQQRLGGFGFAQQQQAVRRQRVGDALQHRRLGGAVEIHQHIAAEDEVEIVQPAIGIQQIEDAEIHHAAQMVGDAPMLAAGAEPAGALVGR